MTLRIFFSLLLLLPLTAHAASPVFRDLDGHRHTLAELKGSIAVVNFWATWCAPCREEMPMLAGLQQRYKQGRVRFVAISADDGNATARVGKLLAQPQSAGWSSLTLWLGAGAETLDRLRLGQTIPATLILDEENRIVCRVMGEARAAELASVLDWLLAGKTGDAPPAEFHHESAVQK
jgi:thiol-disulfide isomerase/thioredoxin